MFVGSCRNGNGHPPTSTTLGEYDSQHRGGVHTGNAVRLVLDKGDGSTSDPTQRCMWGSFIQISLKSMVPGVLDKLVQRITDARTDPIWGEDLDGKGLVGVGREGEAEPADAV